MRYFHCPTTYRGKAYGCGAGPYNATQAYLDLGMKCPRSGHALKPFKVARKVARSETCAVRGIDGRPYCFAPAYDGAYCRRHAYIGHSESI